MTPNDPQSPAKEPDGKLGNLADRAQMEELGIARLMLLVLGCVLIGFNVYRLAFPEWETNANLRATPLAHGVGVAVGVVFLPLSALVMAYPRFSTVAALVVYLVFTLAGPQLDPLTQLPEIHYFLRSFLAVVLAILVQSGFKIVRARNQPERPSVAVTSPVQRPTPAPPVPVVSLIGQRIVSQHRSWLVPAVFAGIGAVLLLLALAAPVLGIGSLLPLALALVLFLFRERQFVARFTENELVIERPTRVTIAYADLRGLRGDGRSGDPAQAGPRHYAIQVYHRNGVATIPAELDRHSDEVFRFLLRQFRDEEALPVHPQLEAYRSQKAARYGAGHVWCYNGIDEDSSPDESWRLLPWLAGIALGGLGWLACGAQNRSDPDLKFISDAGGSIAMTAGLLFCLVWDGYWRKLRKKTARDRASLILCPDGLALVLGTVEGQVAWSELERVVFVNNPVAQTIVLHVAGRQFDIPDLFNRPLSLIYQHILHYSRSGADFDLARWEPSQSLRPGSTGITPGHLLTPTPPTPPHDVQPAD